MEGSGHHTQPRPSVTKDLLTMMALAMLAAPTAPIPFPVESPTDAPKSRHKSARPQLPSCAAHRDTHVEVPMSSVASSGVSVRPPARTRLRPRYDSTQRARFRRSRYRSVPHLAEWLLVLRSRCLRTTEDTVGRHHPHGQKDLSCLPDSASEGSCSSSAHRPTGTLRGHRSRCHQDSAFQGSWFGSTTPPIVWLPSLRSDCLLCRRDLALQSSKGPKPASEMLPTSEIDALHFGILGHRLRNPGRFGLVEPASKSVICRGQPVPRCQCGASSEGRFPRHALRCAYRRDLV